MWTFTMLYRRALTTKMNITIKDEMTSINHQGIGAESRKAEWLWWIFEVFKYQPALFISKWYTNWFSTWGCRASMCRRIQMPSFGFCWLGCQYVRWNTFKILICFFGYNTEVCANYRIEKDWVCKHPKPGVSQTYKDDNTLKMPHSDDE